jgi:multidrug efflux system outer membrane protein
MMTGYGRPFQRRLLKAALIAAAMLAGACASAPTSSEAPKVALPPAYVAPAGSAPASGASIATQPWASVFQDPALQSLITTALDANVDLRIAAVRVLEARASLGIVRANQFPQVDASATAGGQRTPKLGDTAARTAGALQLEGTASWDLDFWGELRSASAAARAQIVASEWGRRAVVTALISDVATSYFSLRALDAELDIARRTLTTRQDSLNLARVREQGGVTTLLDVRQAEQLVYDATSTIADLERRIALEEHNLAVLLGRTDAPVTRGSAIADQPHAPDVPAGLPSDLLERRPDVRQAEQLVVAASAELDSARAAFFPRVTLTGAGGVASTALTSLFTGGAGLWSAAASALQPVFNGGRLKSQRALADARRQDAMLSYAGTVQQAFREAADALISYTKSREFRSQQELLEQAAADARRLADVRYQGGATSYLEVLDADTRLFAAELGLVDARRQELTSFVEVYRALGGGWQ